LKSCLAGALSAPKLPLLQTALPAGLENLKTSKPENVESLLRYDKFSIFNFQFSIVLPFFLDKITT
ncbi:MAG: hypothetical protein RBQ87_06870, partial [Candidatus Cloacimonadaceae bacterium]|nr:hypothetical protein [Candidatus Cloacimonadaceae bacterium]